MTPVGLWAALALLTPAEYETAALPLLGADSDLGMVFGAALSVAEVSGAAKPYNWRLFVQASSSLKEGPDGAEFPLQRHVLRVDVPKAFDDSFRLTLHARYERLINAGYFGLGGQAAADEPAGAGAGNRRFQVDMTEPFVRLAARWNNSGVWKLVTAVQARYVSSSAYPGSVFAAERAGLVGTEPYAALQFSTGAVLDTRDNEPTPSGGQLVEATVRVGTSVSGSEPMTYTGLNAYLRSYHRVARQPDLVLAARLLVDSLHGQVPLVELAHAGGYTIDRTHGYTRGQRGVPLGRFHGRHKALASLEARSMPWAIGTGHRLGLAAFGEAGWVAQNLTDDLPTIWNLGFGFRWLIGRANLLRVDWSYAPSAALIRPHAPLAIYIDLSQAF